MPQQPPATGGTSLRHGQRSTYTHHGCRCRWCRHAESAYRAARDRKIGYGTWQRPLPTEPVRQHIQALAAAGISERQIAALAGVPRDAIRRITYGASGRPPSKTISRRIAAQILAIPIPTEADPDGTRLVDATGSRRRLQALTVAGWPLLTVAGRDRDIRWSWARIRSGRVTQIAPATEAAIRAAYDRLWSLDPAGECRPADVRAAVALGHRNRWAVALAWDDDDINNPSASPSWTGRCGTPGGYYDHSQLGTPSCQPCRDAVAAAARERKTKRRPQQQAA